MIQWIHVISMVSLVGMIAGCDDSSPKAATETPAVPVNFATATIQNFAVKRTYPALASSPWQVRIIGRVEGWLESRNFKQGDFVEEDQLLFVIEQAPYEAALLAAEAALSEAKAQRSLAKIIVDRNAPLVSTGAIAAEEFDQYVANLAIAEASVESAAAQVVQAELNLSYTEIRAPIAGRVGATSIDPGTLVQPGSDASLLCNIMSANPIRVNFAPSANEFPEYLAKWTKDTPLKTEITIPRETGWSQDGNITFVDNMANPDTSLIRMWTEIPNDDYRLLPGQYCEATVTMDVLQDAITIPTEAIVQRASDTYVWLVGSDSTVKQTKVEVSHRQDGTAVIASGLREGERVVKTGTIKLRFNGTKVKQAPPPRAPGEAPPGMGPNTSKTSSSDDKKTD